MATAFAKTAGWKVLPALLLCPCLFAALDMLAQAPGAGLQDTQLSPMVQSRNMALESLPAEARGDLLMHHGSYAAAIDAYMQAWPRSAALWNKTGLAYHHLYALDEAMKDYQMALTLDPRNAEAHNNLGAVYHGKHLYALAEKEYRRALKYQPGTAVAYCNLGTAYFATHATKKGIKAYRRAMQLDPQAFNVPAAGRVEEGAARETRVDTAYSLAKVYASAGRNQDALVSLRAALAAGFRDRKRLMADREFAALRGTAEFQKMMVEERLD